MIRVTHKTIEHDEASLWGNTRVISIQTVDESTGRPVSNKEVYQAFQNLDILGVHVKLRSDKLFKADAKLWPSFGVITAIDDLYVWLGSFEVPKQDFLDWYELD